jgi:H+/gluconate symporter-like permease
MYSNKKIGGTNMNFQIMILFIAIILFAVLAFKRINALILAPIVTIFVIESSGLPILDSLKGPFMASTTSYINKYFLVFFVGALFGAIYQFTGAATSIANWIAGFSNGKFVAPIVMIITGILTYGGVSGFVVFFAIYPIALQMFRRANLSRVLIPASISAGTWTWSMTGPGSPSIQNVIPMTNLGTTATAAFLPSLIATIAEFAMIFLWLEYRSRKLSKRGMIFDDPSLTPLPPEEMQFDDSGLPNPYICLIPIIMILVSFNIFKLPVETSVMIGVGLSVILLFKKIGGINEWIEVFNKGGANSGVAILNTSIVVGFAGVVQTTVGFSQLIENLKNMNMSGMVFVAITVAIAAGAAGSASGGLGIAFNALKETYLSMGVLPEHIHRISAIAAGTLDTLPHQGAQITLLSICHLTHKQAYFDIFITQIVIPILTLAIFIPLASMGL